MNRTTLAFLVAPLWVPAATALWAFHMFPYPEQRYWIYITTVISAIFGYGGVLTLGLPAFAVLRGRKHTAFWIAPVLGFGIGAVTGVVFFVLFGLSLGNSFTFVWHELVAKSVNWPSPLLQTCALGAVVGTTLWLIARPDCESSP